MHKAHRTGMRRDECKFKSVHRLPMTSLINTCEPATVDFQQRKCNAAKRTSEHDINPCEYVNMEHCTSEMVSHLRPG